MSIIESRARCRRPPTALDQRLEAGVAIDDSLDHVGTLARHCAPGADEGRVGLQPPRQDLERAAVVEVVLGDDGVGSTAAIASSAVSTSVANLTSPLRT
jgi:hypothetical protein